MDEESDCYDFAPVIRLQRFEERHNQIVVDVETARAMASDSPGSSRLDVCVGDVDGESSSSRSGGLAAQVPTACGALRLNNSSWTACVIVDSVRNKNTAVEFAQNLDMSEADEVIERRSVGDDDHPA